MHLFLQTTGTDGSFLGATLDVALFFIGAVVLSTLFWYFWQKKDQQKIEVLQKSLDKIQPEYEVLHNQHEHLKAEHLKVKQGLADLVDNYNSLNTKHETFIVSQTTSKKVTEQADEERQSLLDSYESMESNYNALDTKYNDSITTLDRLEEEIENIKDERSELKLVNVHLRKEIKKLSAVLEENGTVIDSIIDPFDSGSTKEDDEIEKLIGASKGQQFISADNNVSQTNFIANQEDLEAIYETLKQDFNQLKVEHNQLKQQHQELQATHNQSFNNQQSAAQLEISAEVLGEYEKLQDEHSQLQDNYVSIKDELENRVLPKLRATQALLNKKEEKYRKLATELEEQSSKVQNSSSQLKSFEGVRATNQALYTRNKDLTEKNSDLEKQYEKLNGEYAGLYAQFQLLRDQFSMVEGQLDSAQSVSNQTEFAQLSKDYSNLKIEFLAAADQQKLQSARLLELESLLQSINESSSYGIIYATNNLQIIEGIDTKLERLLKKEGLNNWQDLANADQEKLQAILTDGGITFKAYDSTSWPQQAQLLTNGKWKAFRDLEANLINGKKQKESQQEYDDLKVIEGIGPKIEVLLNNAKIFTFKKLSKTGIGELKRILKAAGSRYSIHDPSTWPEQANLAAGWKWTELENLQKDLKGGRVQA